MRDHRYAVIVMPGQVVNKETAVERSPQLLEFRSRRLRQLVCSIEPTPWSTVAFIPNVAHGDARYRRVRKRNAQKLLQFVGMLRRVNCDTSTSASHSISGICVGNARHRLEPVSRFAIEKSVI